MAKLPIRPPDNLIPIVYRCINCKSTIRWLEATDSYILMSTSKEVDNKTIPLCSFCEKLMKSRGDFN